ncbi:TPA: 16S rRNA (guanine(527)-N(7))-methyltransferase RsmG [Candidatus Peribacteria bacterium]|nr:MAG: 16S rRNA (guanine(527)-N(7))-methyltransferase RsmG [Candidatus Peribacteria bacterium RIFOXYD2_FULL_58_15]HAI98763.1 16S rRNA (guanine(527)-N(7))-methyltransferase RsmG [Candidatus Peribacteria bacterium]HAS34117.1 16S rRNA (guanine(527)-N(7))-methyltransferase RsmG [Candidatus Peribacteria bacterium]
MIPEAFHSRLEALSDAFLRENEKLNLSAMRTKELNWYGNIADSLAILDTPLLHPDSSDLRILDLGTGGGYPLLPLAICREKCRFTGIDSIGKKMDAVRRIIATLEISNAEVVTGRSEELGHDPAYRERFDLVLSRAVAPLNVLLEWCAPFAKVGGRVVAWKSMKIDAELTDSLLARAELSCHLTDQYPYELPAGWGERQLLVFEKTFKTHEKYPRPASVIKKHPLR